MANQYGIDMGEVYRTTEQVKGARTQNKMNALTLGEQERVIAERPAKEAAAAQRQNQLLELRTQASTGDSGAQQQLLSIDPDGGPKFIEAVNKMDDRQIAAAKQSVEEIGQLSATLLQMPDQDKAADLYSQFRSTLSPEQQAKMPEQFNSQFLEVSLAKATPMMKLLENPKVITAGGEDITYKAGSEVSRVDTPIKTSAPLVNIQQGGAKKEQELLAGNRVKTLTTIQDSAVLAQDQLESLDQMESIDINTGFGTEARGQIARVWDSLGGDGAALTGVDPTDMEKFKGLAMKQVLDIMASQKGPQTDSDAKRIEKAVVDLGKTTEANQFVLDSARAIANRKIEQSAFYEDFLDDNQTLVGANKAWRDFKTMTPMVSDIVADPKTGAPMFFYQFRETMRENGFSDSDIVEGWQRMNVGGK
tara:strand:- start:15896 stop:17152 length:1257 start_codon:yes stop_codon:yes gene_type:complete